MATKTETTATPIGQSGPKTTNGAIAAQKAVAKAVAKKAAKTKTKAKPKAKAKAAAPKSAPKKDSLVDKLIALLSSAKGATNEEAVKLGFKTAQSVRGTINGPVRKRHKVVVERDDKRGNVYRIKK